MRPFFPSSQQLPESASPVSTKSLAIPVSSLLLRQLFSYSVLFIYQAGPQHPNEICVHGSIIGLLSRSLQDLCCLPFQSASLRYEEWEIGRVQKPAQFTQQHEFLLCVFQSQFEFLHQDLFCVSSACPREPWGVHTAYAHRCLLQENPPDRTNCWPGTIYSQVQIWGFQCLCDPEQSIYALLVSSIKNMKTENNKASLWVGL